MYDDATAEAYLRAVVLHLPSPDFQTQMEPGMPRARANPSEGMNTQVGMIDARRALDTLRAFEPAITSALIRWMRDPDAESVNLTDAYEGREAAIALMNGAGVRA